MEEAPAGEGLPPSLRLLKALVIVLTLVMIGGVITVVALLVTRMPQALNGVPVLPEAIQMPEGAKAQAVTFGPGWIAVVTEDGCGRRCGWRGRIPPVPDLPCRQLLLRFAGRSGHSRATTGQRPTAGGRI